MPLVKFEITNQERFASGMDFGETGTYELLHGIAHYEIDSEHCANKSIIDLKLAPTNHRGQVKFESDFVMLHPTDPRRGNGAVLYDVVNRGTKTVLTTFNSVSRSQDPMAPVEPGNGFLFRKGYTVVFGGWQADVPTAPGLIGMRAPEALDEQGQSIQGQLLCWFQEAEATQWQLLSHKNHLPHAPEDPEESGAQMFVKDHPNDAGELISRDQWSFARRGTHEKEPEPHHVYMESSFQPGRIYELVYTTRGSRVIGLGFAAMRDMVSFLKYGIASDGNPCAGALRRAHAFGQSQSGRFLRTYLYTGINTDESGRQALDALIPHVAGGMKGEFNLRFGQPSKDICYVLPGLFPCSDSTQIDPLTGTQGALLDCSRETGHLPKVIFTNTSAEYWRGDAALIHTDLLKRTGLSEDLEFVRRYHFSGTQHGIGAFPLETVRSSDGWRGQQCFSCMDYSPLLRSVLQNLDRWVAKGEPPPPSRHPRLEDGTAQESKDVMPNFAKLPGLNPPERLARAQRLDYGSELEQGRTLTLPAVQGEQFPAFVSVLNDDLNEIAGIRLPELSVPLATFTGWNLRHPKHCNPDLFLGISGGLAGSTIPFPATRFQRESTGDPRLSIEERYHSREDYLQKLREAGKVLVGEGYLLEEDIEGIVQRSAEIWNVFTSGQSPS
jgi:hypothetical protein